MYVLGVGIAGGMVLGASSRTAVPASAEFRRTMMAGMQPQDELSAASQRPCSDIVRSRSPK